ncbi:MAG: tetratricopeptide repeat protein [Candidatus Azobacteroides sp.]|nr:tetratricopeptide repeat protein [Candidatus Azobacteroides sp.]
MLPDKQWANKLVLISTVGLLIMSAACRFKVAQHPDVPGNEAPADTILQRTRNIDSLVVLAETYEQAGNKAGAIKIFQKLGRLSRESDNLVKAIEFHNRALSLAEEINDTNEIISCLNQIGTNYRRIGAYEDAATYHYKALQYSEQPYDATPEIILKNKVISLNGIGNIYLMLDNLDAAHATFLAALEGETQLGSDLGMAINYANIGAIFESKEMYDSARVYYEHSMKLNRLANSALGISLCHNHFGRLAELRGDWNEALGEYHAAYDIMDKGADRWHWMEACLSIIRVNIEKGDLKTAAAYIDRAETTAKELRSNDYSALVYKAKYSYFEKKGDFRRALDNYILSRHYADSTLNLKNVNHIHNLRVLYETERKEVEIRALKNEKQLMRWLAIFGAALFLLTIGISFFLWRWTTQKKRLAEKQKQIAEQQIIQLQ